MKTIGRLALHAALVLISLPFLFPLVFALVSSFKESNAIFSSPFTLPEVWLVSNYVKAWNVAHFGQYFLNTVFLTVASMALTALVSLLGCFVLARYRFKLSGFVYVLLISGMMVPIQITVIPLAYVFGILQLKDNYVALTLLYTAFNIPMSTLILTSFLKEVPNELLEASVIDGCTPAQTLFRVVTPVVVPALASLSIFNFLNAWNNLIIPLVFINNENLRTIPLGLLSFTGMYSSDYGGLMAAIIIACGVPVLSYLLLQEKVEKGLTSGAVKG